jgi:hypothetical protein
VKSLTRALAPAHLVMRDRVLSYPKPHLAWYALKWSNLMTLTFPLWLTSCARTPTLAILLPLSQKTIPITTPTTTITIMEVTLRPIPEEEIIQTITIIIIMVAIIATIMEEAILLNLAMDLNQVVQVMDFP